MSDKKSSVSIPSIEEMLEAGAHFGHTTSRWHPKIEPYLFGKRGGIHIVDLEKTREKLEQATRAIIDIVSKGKKVLFVGVKPLARAIVKEQAERSESPFMVNRWIGGTLTNSQAIATMTKRAKKIEDDKATGRLAKYTKFEQLTFEQELKKLEDAIGGIRGLEGAPGAVFLVDVKYDKTALREARKKKLPIVAITDTNINPTVVDYPIPANDDALKSITLITTVIADAVIEGKNRQTTPSEDNEKSSPSASKSQATEDKKNHNNSKS
jgi:small subunit ribosomal protein S2